MLKQHWVPLSNLSGTIVLRIRRHFIAPKWHKKMWNFICFYIDSSLQTNDSKWLQFFKTILWHHSTMPWFNSDSKGLGLGLDSDSPKTTQKHHCHRANTLSAQRRLIKTSRTKCFTTTLEADWHELCKSDLTCKLSYWDLA